MIVAHRGENRISRAFCMGMPQLYTRKKFLGKTDKGKTDKVKTLKQ